MPLDTFANLEFQEASVYWLNGRRSISPATRLDYENCIKPLCKYFGPMPLKAITLENVQNYQAERSKTVGPVRVNRELGVVLFSVLERAGLGGDIRKFYEGLPFSKKRRGVALEPEEERYMWKLARENPRWQVVYYAAVLGRNTCMGTKGDSDASTPEYRSEGLQVGPR